MRKNDLKSCSYVKRNHLYVRVLIYFLFASLMASQARAQSGKQYAFTHYHIGTGMSSNYVNNVTQDLKGFIWLATVSGLQRYDGHKFLTFRNKLGDPQSIPTDNVASVFTDKDKQLWVSTADNKVGTFNTSDFKYKEITIHGNLGSSIYVVKRFFETKEGKLFLFMEGKGLYIFDKRLNAFVPYEGIKLPNRWKLTDLVNDTLTGRFWLAADSGLAVFDPVTQHLSYRGNNMDNDPVIKQFANERWTAHLYVDSNRFFFTTWPLFASPPLFHYYNSSSGEKKVYNLSASLKIGYHEIEGYMKQRNGRLWFYGMPFLTEFQEGAQSFHQVKNEYKNDQSIKFDRVNYLFEDREQNLWVCSDNGIFLFNPDEQPFNSNYLTRVGEKEPVEGPVEAVLQFKNGNVWVGSWGLGLYCYDKNFDPLPLPAGLRKVGPGWSIWCMIEHSSTGLAWIGLQGGKLIVFDPVSGKADFFSPAIFERRTIRQVTEDKEGNLWFGTHGGHIIKWDRKMAAGNPRQGFQLIQKSRRVHKLFADKDGYIWVATLGLGLLKIDPSANTMKSYTKNGLPGQRLSTDAPYDIVQYNDSLLLIANGTIDILNTKTNQIRSITTDDGLPSNTVVSIRKHQNGLIWAGMINGLCRVNLERKIFIYYDRRDGIAYDNFMPSGAFTLMDGKLVFTTDHDFLVFNPAEMVQKDPPPDAKILDFKVANHPFLVDSLQRLTKITLDYNKASVTINFGTLSYVRKNKKVFYFQLDKIDDDWILADDWHQAIYTYIPPGMYNFKVKTVNGSGIQSKNITTLVIYVKPPFWKTWWFYGLILLAIVGLLYWVDKERIRRLLSLQQVRTQIAANLHDEINTTLNNIHLLSEIAKIKADKDVTKSKEYIDQINTKSRRMMDAMDDMLWSLAPENDSMQKTLERMNEFAEGLKHTHGCTIILMVDEKVKSLKLDMKLRHEIFFIFKEALNNVIQHSSCTDSIINIDLVKSSLLIKIHDNGTGFDVKSTLGNNGMKEMAKRAITLNAVLDIQSDKKGTSIILQVPVK